MVRCKETEYDRQLMETAPVDTIKWPITEKMIMDCLSQQLPTGEEGKYARLVKLDIRTVTQLKMEYRSISIIDNLWNMGALTKLQLCNNVITRIENLHTLVNLRWLDLSFNSIRKIEGLDNLKKLEVLDLHNNFIQTLENMDNLLRLEMFLVSTNKLNHFDNVRYLRRFLRLRCVSFAGNPMTKNPNFLSYLLAFVPQLTIVDYKKVLTQDREVGLTKYKAQLDKVHELEDKFIRRASVVEAEEAVEQTYKEAFVDGFQSDRFWQYLYENDAEGKEINRLSDTEDIQIMFTELFHRVTKQIFDKGLSFYEMRRAEETAYETAIKEEMEKMQKAGNAMTEEFVEYGYSTMKDIKTLVSIIEDNENRVRHGLAHELPPEFPQYVNQLNRMCRKYVKKLHKVWSTLIHTEVDFNEHLEDVNIILEQSVREIIQNWMEHARNQFGSLRDTQGQLNGRLVEALVTYGEFRHSDTNIPENLRDLVQDKDALMSYLQVSHDHHISSIDNREDLLMNQLKNWLESFSIGLQTKEYERNRSRLMEISHFTDTHYAYLKNSRALMHTTIFIPNVRDDQECAGEDYVPDKEGQEVVIASDGSRVCPPLQWYERLTKRLRQKEKKFKAQMMPKGKKEQKQESLEPDFIL